jgi:hypothetical protein
MHQMIIPPRTLSGILRSGLLLAACSAWCWPAYGQGSAPSNPLRNVQKRHAKAAVADAPKAKATSKVKPVSHSEPAATAPKEVKIAPKPIPRRVQPQAQVRRTALGGLFPPIRQPLGYGPPPAASFETKVVGPAAPAVAAEKGVIQGEVIYEDGYLGMDDGVVYGDDCCGGVGCYECCLPCPVISFQDTELFFGVHGNTGPRNRGESGSFGFHEGFNWGTPFPCTYGAIGAQVGLRATQSSLSGTDFTDSTRNQIFLTGGLFRRVDWGLQGGVVLDYLSEDWYSSIDMLQIRSELSWVFPCCHEFGFWFTANANTQEKSSDFSGATASVVESWQATDLYAFFYRRRYECHPGAESRIFAGFTGDSDGLIGADARLPIGTNWALQSEFTYLVPREGTGTAGGGHREEGWNVGISLVWYPGCRGFGEGDYFRPLFNVAGNGTFMLDQQ